MDRTLPFGPVPSDALLKLVARVAEVLSLTMRAVFAAGVRTEPMLRVNWLKSPPA